MSLKMNKIMGVLLSSSISMCHIDAHSPLRPIHKRTEIIISTEKASSSSLSQKIKSIRSALNNQLINIESGDASLASGVLESQKSSFKMLGIMAQENSKTLLAVLASSGIVYLVDLTFNEGKLTGVVRDYAVLAKDNVKYYSGKISDAITSQIASFHNALAAFLSGKTQNPVVDAQTLRILRADEAVTLEAEQGIAELESIPSFEDLSSQNNQPIVIVTDQAPIIVQVTPDMFNAVTGQEASRFLYASHMPTAQPAPEATQPTITPEQPAQAENDVTADQTPAVVAPQVEIVVQTAPKPEQPVALSNDQGQSAAPSTEQVNHQPADQSEPTEPTASPDTSSEPENKLLPRTSLKNRRTKKH